MKPGGLFERLIGRIWNKDEGKFTKPDEGAKTWRDAAGEKRSAVVTRYIGVNSDGQAVTGEAMTGLPDSDVRYPKPLLGDVFDRTCDNATDAAFWRGVYKNDFDLD